jgi:hypothetical protein
MEDKVFKKAVKKQSEIRLALKELYNHPLGYYLFWLGIVALVATVGYLVVAWAIYQRQLTTLLGGILFFAVVGGGHFEHDPNASKPHLGTSHPAPVVPSGNVAPSGGGNTGGGRNGSQGGGRRGGGNGGGRFDRLISLLPKTRKGQIGLAALIVIAIVVSTVIIAMLSSGGPGENQALQTQQVLASQAPGTTTKPAATQKPAATVTAQSGKAIAGTPTPKPSPTATDGPPTTPKPGAAVDAGKAPWKSDQQWLQVIMFIALLPLLIVNSFQKVRHPEGGNRRPRSLVQIVAPAILAVLAFIVFVGSDWEVVKPFLLVSQPDRFKVAIIFWIVFTIFAALWGKDLFYAALTVGAPAMAYLVAGDKNFGVLGSLLGLNKSSAVYNLEDTGKFLSVNNPAADLSVAVYILLFVALLLTIIDIGVFIYQERSFGAALSLLLGIGGGLLVYGLGVWLSAQVTIAVIMALVALSAIGSREEWDEGFGMAIFLATFLAVGFGEPLIKGATLVIKTVAAVFGVPLG